MTHPPWRILFARLWRDLDQVRAALGWTRERLIAEIARTPELREESYNPKTLHDQMRYGRRVSWARLLPIVRALGLTEATWRARWEAADESYRLARNPGRTPAPDTSGRNHLPYEVSDFTGRLRECKELQEAVTARGSDPAVLIFAVDGMAGVGKTAFVLHIAHRLVDDYPDAQLYIDLQANTEGQQPIEPHAALGKLLRGLGVPGNKIPSDVAERAADWRARLGGRRVLAVLDNVADADQVRPLLPGSPGCLVLITGRRRLVDLEAAHLITLDLLSCEDSVRLFTRIVGEHRCAGDLDSIYEAVALAGYLPLAIRIIAARLRTRPAWTIQQLNDMLHDQNRRPALLGSGVAAAFGLSYRHLERDPQRLFRLLGLHPGPEIDVLAASVLAEQTPPSTEALLEDLVDVNLLQQHTPWRYRFHDLIREYAADCAADDEPEDDRRAAVGRLMRWYLATAENAGQVLMRDRLEIQFDRTGLPVAPIGFHEPNHAFQWCETELPNLVATARQAFDQAEYAIAWQLPASLWGFFYLSKRWTEWITTYQTGRDAAQLSGDRYGAAIMFHGLGTALWKKNYINEARAHYEQALRIWMEIGYARGAARTLNNLGATYGGEKDYFDFNQACAHYLRSLKIRVEIGDKRGEAQVLNNLGEVHRESGNLADATTYLEQALMLYREMGERYGEGHALTNLGETSRQLKRFDEAVRYLEQALQIRTELGGQYDVAETLTCLGKVYADRGMADDARAYLSRAQRLFEELDDKSALDVRRLLADLHDPPATPGR